MLVSLLVCLIPTTIGGLLSAIGIAGMDRLVQHNVLAMSGRAVEAAGDVNTLLDKTGTITLGNRQATEFIPMPGVNERDPPTPRSFRRSPTRRRKAVRSSCWRKRNTACAVANFSRTRRFIPFTAQRESWRNYDGREIRKGAVDAIEKYINGNGSRPPKEIRETVDRISCQGARRSTATMRVERSTSKTSSKAE